MIEATYGYVAVSVRADYVACYLIPPSESLAWLLFQEVECQTTKHYHGILDRSTILTPFSLS